METGQTEVTTEIVKKKESSGIMTEDRGSCFAWKIPCFAPPRKACRSIHQVWDNSNVAGHLRGAYCH